MSEELQATFTLTYDDSPVGRLAVMTMDNGRDHTRPNVLGERSLASLAEALDELEAEEPAGLLLTGKRFVFAAGADTDQFEGMDAARAREAAAAGHAQLSRLGNLPFPTLAAINGVCLGGGLEVALHCDHRTVSTGARALAFPEVFLSIVPAWGGTQLATRLLGAPGALRVIVRNALESNRTLTPARAHEQGLADRLIDSAGFLEDSHRLLEQIVAGEVAIERDVDPAAGLEEALAETREHVDGKVHGATSAPYRAMELIEFAARGGDLDEGREREIDALADLLPARHAQAAIYSFELAQRRIKRQPWRPEAPARDIGEVGVVGGGKMGSQIAALLLRKYQVPLVVKDVDEEVLASCREHLEGSLAQQVERGRMGEGRARFLSSLVTTTLDYDDLAGADLVIEAVLERMDLKQQVLTDLEEVVDEGAVLATNTSSLSLATMGEVLDRPERLVGLHFFHPVEVMPLLEIIRPEATSDEALATAFEVSRTLRKSGVLCADTPGFIVNRLLMRFNGAAMEALSHGRSFREIDRAVRNLGLPMGPFELFEFVGLDVAYHTARTLHEAFPDRYPLDHNLERIAGLDVGGVYDPDTGEPHPAVREAVDVDPETEPMPDGEIRDAALRATVEEAGIMLEDGVVADARDIDTGLLLGAGFPFFMGGICKFADETGLSEEILGGPLVTAEDRAAG